MIKHEIHMLYKSETGKSRWDYDYEFDVYRSKGQWIVDTDDDTIMGIISFPNPDPEYIEWLENKVMELL